jgi:hypothetical protein
MWSALGKSCACARAAGGMQQANRRLQSWESVRSKAGLSTNRAPSLGIVVKVCIRGEHMCRYSLHLVNNLYSLHLQAAAGSVLQACQRHTTQQVECHCRSAHVVVA